MKKFTIAVLVIFLLGMVIFTSCSRNEGTLICGVTEYEPMNFRDARGNWTGFDTEFALLVGKKLGMKVEFQLIEWSNKFIELDSRSIDAIWNGFTATANEPDGTPRINLCDMTYSYMLNTQCVVVRAERASEFTSAAALAGKTLAVEAGSAGETKARNLAGENGQIIGAPAQINTFMEVKAGASDGAIIDLILAQQITGSGDYTDLVIADIDLGNEVFAIGFRSGDPLRDRVNQAMLELYQEGKLMEIALKYGLNERLVIDTTFGQ
ncbi:MAG: transporter substrate-binding domain-containing protein [Treponema sp.]|nr:transporter substrate-binding domain-containing protein [Treponema sp.]